MINTVIPDASETLSGYLYRVLTVNHYPDIQSIADIIGIRLISIYNNDFSQDELIRISSVCNINIAVLNEMSGKRIRSIINPEHSNFIFVKRRIKFCPDCFRAKRNQHKFEWTLHPIHTCFIHQVLLMEFCPRCESQLNMKCYFSGACCQCAYPLVEAESEKIRIESIFYQTQLVIYSYLIESPNAKQHDLSVNDFIYLKLISFHLLEGLQGWLPFSGPLINCFKNKKDSLLNGIEASNAWAYAVWMYWDFPRNFYEVLERFLLNKTKQAMYYNLKCFNKLFLDMKFTNIRDAYYEFWVEKADKGRVRRDFSVFKLNPDLHATRKYFRKDEVRNIYGLSYELIENYAVEEKFNLLKVKNIAQNKYFIEKESFKKAFDIKQKMISKSGVGKILGINKTSVISLINSGLLATFKITSRSVEKLDQAQVNEILQQCRGKYVPSIPYNYIRFHKALIKYSVCKLSVERILKFTMEKCLQPVCTTRKGTLEDNYYSISELEVCIDKIKTEQEMYYLKDVMRVLKIGEVSVKKKMKMGNLIPDKIITLKDGRKRYLFEKGKVHDYLNRSRKAA
jgi:hypothetical protein